MLAEKKNCNLFSTILHFLKTTMLADQYCCFRMCNINNKLGFIRVKAKTKHKMLSQIFLKTLNNFKL